jgi:cysteine desulfurase/selenocysteine lyase
MSLDVAAIRRQFPIFQRIEGPFHYLDNAATGQICAAAAEALIRFETAARANVKRGVYRLADEATTAFDEARTRIAAYVNAARAEEIVLTSGTTFSINLAAHCLAPRLRPGEEILISELEHHSNIVPWQLAAERTGAILRAIPVTEEGRLALDRVDEVLSPRTRIIALTHASNVTGAVTHVARIAEAARSVGALLLLDGAQRAPHGPFDVQALGCDLYAFSGHKMFGPTGAGALWARGELLAELPPFLGGGEMIRQVTIERTTYAPPPHRFEAGTPPIGPCLGMGAAAQWLMAQDWAALAAHELFLTERLLDGLGSIPAVRIYGPLGLQSRLGVVAFAVDGIHAHDVCQMLDTFGVALRGGHHCAQPLMAHFDVVATARASLAPYNDAGDIDALLNGLEHTIRKLR